MIQVTSWNSVISSLVSSLNSKSYHLDPNTRIGTDFYIVPSNRGQDLIISLPLVIHRDISSESSLPLASSSGAVQKIIEILKKKSHNIPGLAPLRGAGTSGEYQYQGNVEPCTVAGSPSRMGSALWHADDQNRVIPGGLHLEIHAAIPALPVEEIGRMRSILYDLGEAVSEQVNAIPIKILEKDWRKVHDQQSLRAWLKSNDLICFIGDGTRPARSYSRYRSWFRIAGPKEGVHVPFSCPEALEPVEVTLEGSGETCTGLGIRSREIFAIIGANAEGKSSLLQAVLSGEDDHMNGDGREDLVTIPGSVSVDATNIELRGADVSRFFSVLPPGLLGAPSSVHGQGSGSLSMASRIQDSIRKRAPLIVIDEDRAAMNLMVPSYSGTKAVSPLSSLCSDRGWMDRTAFIIAGSGMEQLVARSDRILRLVNHVAEAVSPDEYITGLIGFYRSMADELEKNSRE